MLRKNEGIFNEGRFKCIRTARSWYVLDYIEHPETDYSKRRLELLKETPLPYKLYPINIVINTIEQLVSNKTSGIFYTDPGRIFKWKKQKFYKIEDFLVQQSWLADDGNPVVLIKEYGITKAPSYNNEKYARLIEVNRQLLLYGFTEEKGTFPKRVKL
jgi:hypothetical protein